MKKRKLAALLTACMLLLSSFAGCAQTTEEQSAQTQEQTTAETTEEPAQEESEAETTEQASAHEGEWTFTDSLGRTVTLEGELTRVAPSGNLAQQCLFSVAPEKMVGLGSDLGETAAKYYGEIADLPVFGAFYGSKANLNREALLAADPQIVIDIGEVKDDMAQELDQLQEQIGIPVVFIEAAPAMPSAPWESCSIVRSRQTKLQTTAIRQSVKRRKMQHPSLRRSARVSTMVCMRMD